MQHMHNLERLVICKQTECSSTSTSSCHASCGIIKYNLSLLSSVCGFLQPMDKLERIEMRKQAEKFVEPGFKLVMQVGSVT